MENEKNDESTKGIHEYFNENPEKADLEVFGRKVDPTSRRGFFKGMGLLTMAGILGVKKIPFADNLPSGFIPVAMAEDSSETQLFKTKDGLTLLNDRPLNAETPAHLLDDKITPANRHFIRNNGLVPEMAMSQKAQGWSLKIDGEVDNSLSLTLDNLKENFKSYKRQVVVECGGNGRAFYLPKAKGNQWSLGAVACSEYTGVLLKDVLNKAGVKKSAVYIGYYGMDIHLSGDEKKEVISRGCPIEKALDDTCMLVWEMNGKPLPALHGFPVRLLVPGFPGSASGKWIKRIWVRNKIHDGTKMTGKAYRVPILPVAPGEETPKDGFKIIEKMPTKSLITYPKSGTEIKNGKSLEIRGHAWSGEGDIKQVDVSYDFGQTWIKCDLEKAANKFAWQHWKASFKLPSKGYYEVWARATDHTGKMQPMVVPGWNPKGYINNSMHRVAIRVI